MVKMPEFERMVVLLTPEGGYSQRVDNAAFGHFMIVLLREIERVLGEQPPDQPLVLQTSLALLPDGQRLVQIDASPADRNRPIRARLAPRLEDLPAPPIVDGPVAVLVRLASPGVSVATPADDLPPPFAAILGNNRAATLDEALMRWAELRSLPRTRSTGRRPAGARLRAWLSNLPGFSWVVDRFSRRSRRRVAQAAPLPPVVPAAIAEQILRYDELAESGDLAPLDGTERDAESLTALIARYPDDPRLYGLRGDCYKSAGDFERAIADYTELLARLPHNSSGYLVRAECNYLRAERQQALADVNRALDCDPLNASAWALRAAMLWDLGATDQALADYEAAIRANPRSADGYVVRARRYAMKGRWAEALADSEAALRCDPHDPQARLMRGMMRRQLAEDRGTFPAEAAAILADCDAALEVEPENAEFWAARAEVKLAARELKLAEEDCRRALELDSDCELAYALLGQIHRRRGEYQECIENCTQALRRGMFDTRVFLCRAEASAALNEIEQALEDCDTVMQLKPDGVDAYGLQAQIHMRDGDFEAAVDDCSAAIAIDPDWYVGYMLRGHARQCLGELTLALEDLNRAVLLAPEDATSRYHRGLVLHRLDRSDEALADFDRAVMLDSELVEAYFHRSIVRMEQGEFEKALLDLDEVLLREPDFAPAYFNRGNVYRWQGNLDAALRDFDAVIDLCPTLAAGYSCRGDIWTEKGEDDRAREDYREAVNLDPGAAEHFTLQRLMAEAMHHQRREQYAEVIARASEAIDLEPAFLPAFAIRAGAYWYAEQHVEAVEDYTHLLEETGETFFALNGRGQVFAEMGEYTAALDDLNRAIELVEGDPPGTAAAYARNGRGLAMAGLERYDEAQREFDASRAICPDNAWLDYNQGWMHHQRHQTQQAAASFRAALEKQSPRLTPRKRSRARAFLASLEKPAEGRQ